MKNQHSVANVVSLLTPAVIVDKNSHDELIEAAVSAYNEGDGITAVAEGLAEAARKRMASIQ